MQSILPEMRAGRLFNLGPVARVAVEDTQKIIAIFYSSDSAIHVQCT